MGGVLIGYLLAALLAALVLATSVASCEHKKVNELKISIAATQKEAEHVLKTEVDKNAAQAIADKLFATTLQKDYDEKLTEILSRPSNPKFASKLRDPGGQSNSCPPTGASPQTDVSRQEPAGCELSDAAGKFLRAQADTADIAATYAQECRAYVYKLELTTP